MSRSEGTNAEVAGAGQGRLAQVIVTRGGMGEPAIAVRGLRKSFGAKEAVAGINLEIAAGSFAGLVGPHIQPVDHNLAGVRPQQAGHHRQGRGLPRPVRPDQPGERARRDLQVDPGHRLLRAETLAQPAHGDR